MNKHLISVSVNLRLWCTAYLAFLVSTDTRRRSEHRVCCSISNTNSLVFLVGKSEAQRHSKSSRQLIFISHFCSTGAGQASKCSPFGFITHYGFRNDLKRLISIYRGSLVGEACDAIRTCSEEDIWPAVVSLKACLLVKFMVIKLV